MLTLSATTTITITGSIGEPPSILIIQDTTTVFSEDYSAGLGFNSTSTTTTEFTGSIIDALTGVLSGDTESVFSFNGYGTIVGNLVLENDTVTLLEYTTIEGSLNCTTASLIDLFGGINADGSLLVYQESITALNGEITSYSTSYDVNSNSICMNTETGGISTYTNYLFNSFFRLGNDYYGCSSTGLYKLEGETDSGTKIPVSITTGVSDFNKSQLKTIADVYTYLRTKGQVDIRVITDEQKDRSGYPIFYDGRNGAHRRRAKTAKGIRGTTYQFNITNPDGEDIQLFVLETNPATLKRRI